LRGGHAARQRQDADAQVQFPHHGHGLVPPFLTIALIGLSAIETL